jgi:hypothetical protein
MVYEGCLEIGGGRDDRQGESGHDKDHGVDWLVVAITKDEHFNEEMNMWTDRTVHKVKYSNKSNAENAEIQS